MSSTEKQKKSGPDAPVLVITQTEAKIIDVRQQTLDRDLPPSHSFDDVHYWLYKNYGSHERLPVLLEVAEEMESEDFVRLLGELWSGFDNVGVYRYDLLWAIRDRGWNFESTIPEMMSPEEKAAFKALPELITIYRGCGPRNKNGFSWSLNRKIAATFPFIQRYWTDQPTLLTATISKHRAASLKLDRGEEEIIVFDYPDEPSVQRTEEPTNPQMFFTASGVRCASLGQGERFDTDASFTTMRCFYNRDSVS
jgi:hypothetical protein